MCRCSPCGSLEATDVALLTQWEAVAPLVSPAPAVVDLERRRHSSAKDCRRPGSRYDLDQHRHRDGPAMTTIHSNAASTQGVRTTTWFLVGGREPSAAVSLGPCRRARGDQTVMRPGFPCESERSTRTRLAHARTGSPSASRHVGGGLGAVRASTAGRFHPGDPAGSSGRLDHPRLRSQAHKRRSAGRAVTNVTRNLTSASSGHRFGRLLLPHHRASGARSSSTARPRRRRD